MLFFIFLLGASLGSFTYCYVLNWDQLSHFLKGRSRCDHCYHFLSISQLIPLFSYIYYHGRCKYCQKKVSFTYFLVELLSGFLLLISYIYLDSWASILMTYLLFTMSLMDLQFGLVSVLMQVCLGLTCLYLHWSSTESFDLILVKLVLAFFLMSLYFLFPSYIGGGDIKTLCILLYYFDLTSYNFILFTASALGLLVGWIFNRSSLPFLPFISFTTILALFLQ